MIVNLTEKIHVVVDVSSVMGRLRQKFQCSIQLKDMCQNFGTQGVKKFQGKMTVTEILVMDQNIPCFSLVFLHYKDIICHFSLFLVNSGHFQLTNTLSTTVLLVELMVIKHGNHIVSDSYWQPRGGCFPYFWRGPKGCAMHPTLFKAPNRHY